MAAVYNITIERGETWSRLLTWTDENDTLINLTGCTAKMQIRKVVGGALVLELSTTNGRITLGGSAGTIALTVTDEDTATFPIDSARYDLVITFPSGASEKILRGSIGIESLVTQP